MSHIVCAWDANNSLNECLPGQGYPTQQEMSTFLLTVPASLVIMSATKYNYVNFCSMQIIGTMLSWGNICLICHDKVFFGI